jgi:hypothetical protein
MKYKKMKDARIAIKRIRISFEKKKFKKIKRIN